ncbi:MAG: ABC transporter ATP-binding protein [Rhizobiaceae bacterium]|nr:ABC transporter ATP-binding protein [Rhizobiaceae bacterium]
MLEVTNLSAGYGDIVAIRDFSFSVNAGEILTFIGANGAGKSTTLMAIMGLVKQNSGSIVLSGEDITDLPVEARIEHGIAIVPEGRRIFPDLTVRENLVVGGHSVSKHILEQGIETVFGYFGRLDERADQLAGSLSGGEQQMLAMGRALISQPKLLLVDELSLGLMPKIVDECYVVLRELNKNGMAIILVEQNTERALDVANNVCVLEAGNPGFSGSVAEISKDDTLLNTLLGH